MLWSEGFKTFGSGRDPWADFERMENEMNRVLSRFTSPSVAEFPAVNLWADGETVVAMSEIPGIDAEGLDISISGKTLTLRGSRDASPAGADESYHRRERWYGRFSRIVELPFNVEADKARAKFVNGVLYVTLPRAEAEKPKKITIKSA